MTLDEKIVEAVARALLQHEYGTTAEETPNEFQRACSTARAAIAAYQAEAWQDISTAPKDGDEMLVTNVSLGGGFPQIVFWDEGRWHVPDAGISYHPDAFTHWRRDCLATPNPPASP